MIPIHSVSTHIGQITYIRWACGDTCTVEVHQLHSSGNWPYYLVTPKRVVQQSRKSILSANPDQKTACKSEVQHKALISLQVCTLMHTNALMPHLLTRSVLLVILFPALMRRLNPVCAVSLGVCIIVLLSVISGLNVKFTLRFSKRQKDPRGRNSA